MIKLNNIYNEDCLTFMDKLVSQGIHVNIIITSPPYNINKRYGSYKDDKELDDYLRWLFSVAKSSIEILEDEGSFFLNIGGRPSDPMIPFYVAEKFLEAGYKLQNTIHWIKSIYLSLEDIGKQNMLDNRPLFDRVKLRDDDTEEYIKDGTSVGHFKPIVSDRFLSGFQEYIFHFTKTGNVKIQKLKIGVPYQDKSNVKRWKSGADDQRDRGNVWFIPYPTIQEGRPHPAVFPVKLPYLCIKLHGVRQHTLVYDPFMGIGTTALACLKLKVDYIGTDTDGEYIKVALDNIYEKKKYLGNWTRMRKNS
ncbi:MAG TPA: site-specific DNA-methyltransferase [Nitrososphaeraceae archaeon]|nr:site-specific DNA-methyltransferase [Nitrososphaeraceae archaeon]